MLALMRYPLGRLRSGMAAAGTAWRDLLLPKEHGSWSLAFEPLGLALLVMPSVGGAWLAVAVVAVFFARRPMRIGFREARAERRRAAWAAFGVLACVATAAFGHLLDQGQGTARASELPFPTYPP